MRKRDAYVVSRRVLAIIQRVEADQEAHREGAVGSGEEGSGGTVGEEKGNLMEWSVEVRLIGPDAELKKKISRKLDQLSANETYWALVRDLEEKHPQTKP